MDDTTGTRIALVASALTIPIASFLALHIDSPIPLAHPSLATISYE